MLSTSPTTLGATPTTLGTRPLLVGLGISQVAKLSPGLFFPVAENQGPELAPPSAVPCALCPMPYALCPAGIRSGGVRGNEGAYGLEGARGTAAAASRLVLPLQSRVLSMCNPIPGTLSCTPKLGTRTFTPLHPVHLFT